MPDQIQATICRGEFEITAVQANDFFTDGGIGWGGYIAERAICFAAADFLNHVMRKSRRQCLVIIRQRADLVEFIIG